MPVMPAGCTELSHQITLLFGVHSQSEELLTNSFSLCDHSMPGWVLQYCAMVIIIAPRGFVGDERPVKGVQQLELLGA